MILSTGSSCRIKFLDVLLFDFIYVSWSKLIAWVMMIHPTLKKTMQWSYNGYIIPTIGLVTIPNVVN